MKNDKLLDAISGLDPDILEEHMKFKENLKQRPKKSAWFKASAAAACLCAVLTASLLLNQVFSKPPEITQQPEISPTPDIALYGYSAIGKFFYEGNTLFSSLGFITHKGYGEDSLKLTVDKKTTERLEFRMNGTKSGLANTLWGYFPENDLTHTVKNGLKVSVNGKNVSEFPSDPGIYDVEIEYSELKKACDTISPYIAVKRESDNNESSSVGFYFTIADGIQINIDGNILSSIDLPPVSEFPISKDIKDRLYDSEKDSYSEFFGGMYNNYAYKVEENGDTLTMSTENRKLVLCHVGSRDALLRELEGVIDGNEDFIEFKEVKYSYNYLNSLKNKAYDVIFKLGESGDTLYLLDLITGCRIDENSNKVVFKLNKMIDTFDLPFLSDPSEFGLTEEGYKELIGFEFDKGSYMY